MSSLESVLKEEHGRDPKDIFLRRDTLLRRLQVNIRNQGFDVALQGVTAEDILVQLPETVSLNDFPFDIIAGKIDNPEVIKRMENAVIKEISDVLEKPHLYIIPFNSLYNAVREKFKK
jgi:hypothetical protein